jgi:hypothetical protein
MREKQSLRDRAIDSAKRVYGIDGEIEIDQDTAEVNTCLDGSVWVQAWVYVPRDEIGLDLEADAEDGGDEAVVDPAFTQNEDEDDDWAV